MTAPQALGTVAVGAYLVALAIAMPEVAVDAAIVGALLAVCVGLTLVFGERVGA